MSNTPPPCRIQHRSGIADALHNKHIYLNKYMATWHTTNSKSSIILLPEKYTGVLQLLPDCCCTHLFLAEYVSTLPFTSSNSTKPGHRSDSDSNRPNPFSGFRRLM